MKWIIRIVLILVVLVLVGIGTLAYYVDSIAKEGIQRGGTYALGVETTIDKADVQIIPGQFAMGNFKVANPSGYKTPHFMQLDDGGVSVDFGTLRQDVVELPQLKLDGMNIYVEEKDGKKNLDIILENVNSKVGGGEDAEPKEEPAEEGKKFVVKEVIVTDVNLGIAMSPIGTPEKPFVVHVEEIRLENVGSDGSGVDMGELIGIITAATMKSLITNLGDNVPAAILGSLNGSLELVGNIGDFGGKVVGDVTKLGQQAVGEIGKGVGEALEGVGEGAGEVIEEAGEALEGVGEGAGEAIENVGEGLGGLLGGNKGDEDEEDSSNDKSDDSSSDAEDSGDNPLKDVGKGIEDVGKGIGEGIGGLLGGGDEKKEE